MKILILSDIHGNLSAFDSVLKDSERFSVDAIALLGDLIDYGMRSNEVVERVKQNNKPIICNIWGNHENAILTGDYSCFSSSRGIECAKYTKRKLSRQTIDYLNKLEGKKGFQGFEVSGKKFLAVHGSLHDVFWKAIFPNGDFSKYREYDYVLSGHSHLSHCFSIFYKNNSEEYRNKTRNLYLAF